MTGGNFNWFLHTMLFIHTQRIIQLQEEKRMQKENADGNQSDDDVDEFGIDIDEDE